MEKYSCSYGNTMSNFVFQNIEKLKDVKYDPEYDSFFGVYCVIQNIIQRGTPSQPSQILIKKLGNLIIDKNSIIPLIKNNNPEWINTIKGDGISLDNPAEIFYDTIYPKYMKDYAFTKQLILPEAKFSDIIEDSKVEFAEQQVDFYLPQANLVIEVDGESHGNYNQINKDKIRDKTLLKSNIKVIRINTYDIKNKTTNLQSIMKNIYSIVAKCEKINEYKEALEHNERYDLNLKYDIIIRFQILLLSLLKLGKLKITDIKWKFNIIKTDYKNISRLIELAYEDIKKWINVITKLLKVNYVVPNLEVFFGEDESGINIDFSIYKRWTDENILNEKCIYIRNDYYDNKNYFKLSTTNILEYKIKLGEQGSDIEEFGYILKNLFGFDQFRDGQLPIIINILEKNDTIGILPTGTGKSLCYQFVSMLQPGVSIVVAPIISLMMDQKENMDAVGMTRTAYIASNLNSSEKDIVLNQFKEG
ncbi:MAG: DEAD/DEAH box helicase, partial [Clostridiaceae bacterium]